MRKKTKAVGAEPAHLRAIELEDVARTLRWHNDAALYDSLGGTFRFVSRVAEEQWIRQKCGYVLDEINLAICVRKTGTHIGNIYLRNIDTVARNGEVQMFIGEAGERGHGYGSSALRQLMDYAFGTLNLQRLYLFVLADNASAIRVYERGGFAVEGRLKRHAFKGGQFRDVLVMGACAPGV